ncbi:rhodanese-like domain-containing protein [Bosea rubneri]|uniref:Rhodanese-like domain-containing protein n=1 Tax=Bosea rubneri TaxID=3075434 RepID=A0ABU3S4A1_9HYPH|nr:rhodanese-like domain-containing protein [Bosea sp. ZW T0_25]MDU0339598.1 rhodanese-like domain-containing protein [Bosea sp. ZW T0_25]
MKRQIAILSAIVMAVAASSASAQAPVVPGTAPPANAAAQAQAAIPKAKQTSLGLYMRPREAAETMSRDGARTLFVDVRTRAEMMFTGWAPVIDGHVPFVEVTEFWDWDDKEGRYKLDANPVFSRDVERLLAAKGLTKNDRVILMCRSGDRSARAADKLAEAGFTQVYSQYEGFEGDTSSYGQRTVNGWKNAGLAWTYKPDKAKFYAAGQ